MGPADVNIYIHTGRVTSSEWHRVGGVFQHHTKHYEVFLPTLIHGRQSWVHIGKQETISLKQGFSGHGVNFSNKTCSISVVKASGSPKIWQS
jgi:hypothetical protein